MNKEIAINNLKVFRDILNSLGVAWWLDGGTCLGAIREKDFIDIDDDTDIGVLEETWNDEVIERLKDNGFELEMVFGERNKGYELAFLRDGVKTDIFFYYLKGDKRWYAMYYEDKMIPMTYDKSIHAEQKAINFLGSNFNIPLKVDDYLRTKYGDYMTKIKKEDWVWHQGPKNIDYDFNTD
jgi:phosphorylcholine metabolism protein LicD